MANPFTPEQISQILEEFFKVVGTRQYIGARYVPIFGRKDEESIEWDNTAPYEPLTIVLYQGNSYTSRQYVPVGVEITNQEFWAITGNYNAQVEQYRRETAAAREVAEGAQNDIDTLLPKSAFNESNTVKSYIDNAISDIEEVLPISDFDSTRTIKQYIDDSVSVIYVSDFGATGDGTTDDSAAIQAAFDACKSSSYKKLIVFESKSYRIDTAISIVDSEYIEIQGNGCTILHNYNNGFVINQNSNNITIRDINFFGAFEPNDTVTPSNSCILVSAISNTALYEAHDITICNCNFTCGVFGIAASNVLNLTVFNCAFAGGVYRDELGAGGYGILEQSCVNVNIKRCYFALGDYARHDIYVSVRQPKTDNIQSKNICICDCFSDRSNMQLQPSGSYFSGNTVRIAVRACVNLHIDGFYAIDGTGVVALSNSDGDIINAVVENIYSVNAKAIPASASVSESRSAISMLHSAAENYSEYIIRHLSVYNSAGTFQDINGQGSVINIENMVVNYQIQITNTNVDTVLNLTNVGVKTNAALSYSGTTTLKGKFVNFYNAASNAPLTCGVCPNGGKISLDCYSSDSKICRITASATSVTWLNNHLVHPFMSLETVEGQYKKIILTNCTKPTAGILTGVGPGNLGLFFIDFTHDAPETSARLYIYDSDGTLNLNKAVQLILM